MHGMSGFMETCIEQMSLFGLFTKVVVCIRVIAALSQWDEQIVKIWLPLAGHL